MTRTSTLLRALTASILLVAALTAAAQEVKRFLVDEGASDANRTRFKARLLDALEYRACFVKRGAGWRMTGIEVEG